MIMFGQILVKRFFLFFFFFVLRFGVFEKVFRVSLSEKGYFVH